MPASTEIRHCASAGLALIGSTLITAGLALLFTWLGTDVLNRYGWTLFFVGPGLLGFTASALFGRWSGSISIGQSVIVTLVALLFAILPIMLLRLEGLICLVMAAPVAIAGGILGGVIAERFTKGGKAPLPPSSSLLLLIFPVLAWTESRLDSAVPSSAVTTSVVLPATPADIWPHLQNFIVEDEPEFVGFRAGIAYPLATRTMGVGLGALRECLLSTGPMPERITVWNPPHILGFDVLATPAPMSELSPYATIEPPHLHGTFISKRGEFRLEALPDGSTRLIGTSWYEQRLWPGWYWLQYSDAIVRAIHHRVYRQIAADVAKDRERPKLVHR